MTHLELIETLYRHREIIDQAYRKQTLDPIPEVLEEIGLFIRSGKSVVQLNKGYLAFVDAVLDRVDYTVVFGDYEKEHKDLVRLKNRFERTPNDFYRERILQRIDDIYAKFHNRDRQIRAALRSLEHQENLELDFLIEEADDVLEKIRELSDANTAIAQTFQELKSVDPKFRARLIELDSGLFAFLRNISDSIDRLSRFIVQTKNKRRQNRRFMQVSAEILSERDHYLEKLLLSAPERYYHTIERSRGSAVQSYPVDEDLPQIKKALKALKLVRPPRIRAKKSLEEPLPQPLEVADIGAITESLAQEGCEDLYLFLLEHPDVHDEEEAFRLYLHLLSDAHIRIEKAYNSHGIRRVRWI